VDHSLVIAGIEVKIAGVPDDFYGLHGVVQPVPETGGEEGKVPVLLTMPRGGEGEECGGDEGEHMIKYFNVSNLKRQGDLSRAGSGSSSDSSSSDRGSGAAAL
jgi:hypothetical protein